MPELPDIAAYITALEARILAQPMEQIRLASVFLLRTVDPPLSSVEGRTVQSLRRIGKRIAIGVEGDLWLAIHLMIAAATYAALIHTGVGAGASRKERYAPGFVAAAWAFAALVSAQLGLGALVAGLRAGRIYNDWPTMGGRFLPGEAFGLSPWFRSIVDDAATAQFDHRLVAYGVVAAAVALAMAAARAAPGTKMALRAKILVGIALAQAALGIVALLLVVPVPLALAHQAFALVLFGMAAAHASATQRDFARAGAFSS